MLCCYVSAFDYISMCSSNPASPCVCHLQQWLAAVNFSEVGVPVMLNWVKPNK